MSPYFKLGNRIWLQVGRVGPVALLFMGLLVGMGVLPCISHFQVGWDDLVQLLACVS